MTLSACLRPFRTATLALGALALLCGSLGATWSIVVVNTRTHEVCVATATCIPRADITLLVPVIVVGEGGGVTQSVLDSGQNRLRIRDGLLAGSTPQEMLDLIAQLDGGFQQRQIGIVDFENDPVSFTGVFAGQAKKSVTGRVDELVYAIQGNVLAGARVIDECEAALRESTGDLGQRVLAAMVRAREFGGDGRCSCLSGAPNDCGAPPPNFEKSAHCGCILIARVGDVDGNCVPGEGCANGDYYMRLNIKGGFALPNDPDPIDQLVERYGTWHTNRQGRPDGILSTVEAVDALPADGVTVRTVRVHLVDLDGVPLVHGGATVEVAGAEGSTPFAALGPVQDLGDGSYAFTLGPVELAPGAPSVLDRLVITAQDDFVRATLYPFLEVRSDAPAMLHAGRDRVSASAAVEVPFVVSEPTRPLAKYWLFGELAGASKARGANLGAGGLRFVVPGRSPFFPAPPGLLDEVGRAQPSYSAPAGGLLGLIGLRLEWRARIFGAGPMLESNAVGFDIVP